MCGIFVYIGKKPIVPTLLHGLKKLEYRGYDSAGLAYFNGDNIVCEKKAGRIANLESFISARPPSAIGHRLCANHQIGIAHTRWATHGAPTDLNAHPHTDCHETVFVVHNGIIENYRQLKEELMAKGHRFQSETDTEVLAHLIEEKIELLGTHAQIETFPKVGPLAEPIQKGPTLKRIGSKIQLEKAVSLALRPVVGTYGLAVMSTADPQKIVLARCGSPLVIGIGYGNGVLAASDHSALLAHTRRVIYLEDGEIVSLTTKGYKIYSNKNKRLNKNITRLEWNKEDAEKGKFKTFMEKEIFEQPESLRNSLRGRLQLKTGQAKLGGLECVKKQLIRTDRLLILACGTSYHAGLFGQYLFESEARLPTALEFASEWRYRETVLKRRTTVLAISQSGETADTLAAVRKAKEAKLLTLGLVNVVGSSIARETEAGVYNHAGPEIGVASTKAFTSQIAILSLMALFLGRERNNLTQKEGKILTEALQAIPSQIETILKQAPEIKKIAEKYRAAENFLYLGRGISYPTALEGALKLKEISYIHAEACPGGEMKHGSLALIDKNFPAVFILPKDNVYEKSLANLEEIKARNGPVIAVATAEDKRVETLADDVFFIPKTHARLSPLLSIIPLQLFALYLAESLGRDVDKPRNLAKSVTVE